MSAPETNRGHAVRAAANAAATATEDAAAPAASRPVRSYDDPAQARSSEPRPAEPSSVEPKPAAPPDTDGERRPIKMLHDRLLVRLPTDGSERRSSGGILIPATAQQSKRLVWGHVVGAGPNVRSAQEGDRVLFSPEDRHEVEVHGDDFLILRERDVHAIAAPRIEPGSTGLYL